MDKGIWIAIIVMLLAALGFFLLQVLPHNAPPAATTTSANSTQTNQQTTQASEAVTDQTSCQAAAQAAAQNDGASLAGANYASGGECYYELDSFNASGNITSINVAPHDTTIASCTTTQSGSLSCQENGSNITEPQFKMLLSTYLPNL